MVVNKLTDNLVKLALQVVLCKSWPAWTEITVCMLIPLKMNSQENLPEWWPNKEEDGLNATDDGEPSEELHDPSDETQLG